MSSWTELQAQREPAGGVLAQDVWVLQSQLLSGERYPCGSWWMVLLATSLTYSRTLVSTRTP